MEQLTAPNDRLTDFGSPCAGHASGFATVGFAHDITTTI